MTCDNLFSAACHFRLLTANKESLENRRGRRRCDGGATAVRRPGTTSSETRTAGNATCLSRWLGEWRGVNRGRADNIDQGEK